MKYFAKLILGKTYLVRGLTFERGKELPVEATLAKYLETVTEPTLLSEGNGQVIKKLPRFVIRTENLTTSEKVENEIKDVPDNLKPKKPGPKPAAD